MIFNVHAGHSLYCRGASGILDEVNEDRKVKDKVIELLRNAGHTVYDCTDDIGMTQGANLSNIVINCNSHSVDLDISIHLNNERNDYVGDGSTGGVEVYGYDIRVQEVSERICSNISSSLNIRNRGFKINKKLYVLRKTRAKAILIECCFVDDKDDTNRWNPNRCAEAIVKGLLNTNSLNTLSHTATVSNTSYLVRVSIDNLNIRSGPGTNYKKTGRYTGKGAFTIVEEKSGSGSAKGWGRLKSGAGWISLDYCKRI